MASEINRLRNVQPVAPSHQQDQLIEKKIKRMVIKEHQIETNQEDRAADESKFKEIAAYFAKEPTGGALHQTRETIPASALELYEAKFSDVHLASDAEATSYLLAEEIDAFLEFVDADGKKKIKFHC